MRANRKSKDPRAYQRMVDALHILICICIVVLAVMAFLNPEEYHAVYPIIFFLAAVLNAVEASGKMKRDSKGRNHKAAGVGFGLLALLLLALTAISALSVWG